MTEVIRCTAAKWLRRAARIPRVSGQARGTFLPLADASRTSLPAAIPEKSDRKTPGQSSKSGRAVGIFQLDFTGFTYSHDLPYDYIDRWQSIWDRPFQDAVDNITEDFEECLEADEDQFAPIRFLETVTIVG